MTTVIFDDNAEKSGETEKLVSTFHQKVNTLESKHQMPIIIYQDGASGAYYIKCSLLASDATGLCDLNAKLDVGGPEGYRANRQLFIKHLTYQRMESDAKRGREFNDIIVEYNTQYNNDIPLKVWGGQHRIKAITSTTWHKWSFGIR